LLGSFQDCGVGRGARASSPLICTGGSTSVGGFELFARGDTGRRCKQAAHNAYHFIFGCHLAHCSVPLLFINDCPMHVPKLIDVLPVVPLALRQLHVMTVELSATAQPLQLSA
jgi:hypothetical protein